jgi:multiple sugar transport system substrate-binding protein
MTRRSTTMTRRSFVRSALLGAGSLLLAACGAAGGGETAGAPTVGGAAPAGTVAAGATSAPAQSSGGAVTLRMALFGSQEAADNTNKLLAGFTAQQPNITLEVTPYQAPDWDGFFQKLLTEVAAGQTPDLVTVATEGAHLMAGRGLAVALDEYVQRDKEQLRDFFADVSPSLIEAMMYDGRLYSLPDNFNAANLFYNKTTFDAAGITYPTDWTKDDFYTNIPKLSSGTSGADRQYGYFWTNRMWGGALPWIFLNGGNVLNEERFDGGDWLWNEFYTDNQAAQGRGGGYRWNAATANSAQNVEALQMLVDLTHELNASPSPAEADSQASQIRTLFANGKLATFPSGGYLIRGLSQDQVDPASYSVTFMPKWQTQRHQFGTAGFFIMEASEHKDEAWELAKWRISTEAMTGQFPFGSSVPTRRSLSKALFEDTYGFKDWQVFYDTFDQFPDTAPIPQPPQANQLTTSFVKNVGLAMTRDLDAKAALDQMQQEFESVLARPS